MTGFLLKRLVSACVMLWLVSLLTFAIFFVLPASDPAARFTGKARTAESVAIVRASLGLDKPVYVQYLRFAKGIVPWPGLFLDKDVYFSYNDNVPVSEEIANRMPVTAVLVLGAVVLWVAISIPLGLIAALRPRSLLDRLSLGFSFTVLAVPSFTIGYVLLYVFWYRLGWAPPSGLPPGEALLTSVLKGRFVLPWIAMALVFIALYSRTTRGNVMEMLQSDAIRTARAKGLPERTVVGKHALRGALPPLVTMLGLDISILLGGTIVIEKVFNLPGLGSYAIESTLSSDIPAVMGVTIVAAAIVLVGNIVVDIAYAFLDPRIREA
jgi:peptide/nickel transport system permease protein